MSTEPNSLVHKLVTKWKQRGSELPPVKEQRRLKRAFLKARKQIEAAKAQARRLVKEAEQKASDAARECVEAFGPHPLVIDDDTYDPVSRGKTIYYRKRRRKTLEGI